MKIVVIEIVQAGLKNFDKKNLAGNFCHSQSKSGLKCMPENYPESVNPHLIGITAMVPLRQPLKSRKIIETEGAFHPQIGVLKYFQFLSRKTHEKIILLNTCTAPKLSRNPIKYV